MELVSVIIPNYNHARFLKRRIDSVLQQTFQDFELIILDDASTDGSRSVIESYRQHPKVKAIAYNEENSGSPFRQWQKGIGLANATWIWIAESDDDCDPGFLASLVPAFDQPDCVLAYSEINWVDEQGKLLKAGGSKASCWMAGPVFLKKHMLMQDHLVNAGMVVFRRDATRQVSPEWLHMKQAGDYWFWCEIARQGRVYSSGQALATFVRHPETLSGRYLYTDTHYEESMQVLGRMHKLGIFSVADIRQYLLKQLVGLETQRKGINPNQYSITIQRWHAFAAQYGLHISASEVAWLAAGRKARHWWKNRFTGAALFN